MLIKVIPSILCIFSLLVIVRGQTPEPDNLEQYYKCWTFAECQSEGEALHGIQHCINMLSQQDLYPIFQYVNATYDMYHSDTIDGAVQEYCNLKGDAQMESYKDTFDGIFSYQNIICSSPDTKAQCKKLAKTLKCLFNDLDELKGKSDCEHD